MMKQIIVLVGILLSIFAVNASELMIAIESGDAAQVKSALDSGSDLNQNFPEYGGFENMTPIVWAIKKKNVEALSTLLEAGANPDSKGGYFDVPAISMVAGTSSIETPMMLEMITLLVNHSVDINALSRDNAGVLHSAAYTARKDVIELLIKSGAIKTIKNKDGQTPFDLAKLFGNDEVLPLLKIES